MKPTGDQAFGKASGDEEQPPLGLTGASGGEEGATFSSVITGLDDMLRALAARFPSAEEVRAEPGARCEWFDMADSDDDEQGDSDNLVQVVQDVAICRCRGAAANSPCYLPSSRRSGNITNTAAKVHGVHVKGE